MARISCPQEDRFTEEIVSRFHPSRQTTGTFVKNEKGALVFTDDADKKKYYGFNKGVKEKVGDLVGKKVKLNAKVKKKEGAKITLMTYVVSVQAVKK